MLQPQITRYADGISAVDAEYVRRGMAAAHIIAHDGHAAFVDTGTTHAVPYLLAALEELGIERAAVDYIFLTHVHLDHAGGAGALLRSLPNARAVLHPRGAPHLIDPTKLIASAIHVYGADTYRRLYGELVPLPKERVIITSDLERLQPRHAAVRIRSHAGACAASPGDRRPLRTRAFSPAIPSASRIASLIPRAAPSSYRPRHRPQFDPEQLVRSIDRLMAYDPRDLYLMHYSRVRDVPRLGSELKHQVREFVRIALEHAHESERATAIASECARCGVILRVRTAARLPMSASMQSSARTWTSMCRGWSHGWNGAKPPEGRR